ncbi:hypothetical protein [Poseidonocella sp. HB161398]|uniref:hypothetical protein n=1 Tax=Poseidonocella sp. HB161398 TaxID=2320855 RepID=UPI0011089204|nr:hypothetical protein [Poseidonocella sp. HB161398]
MAMKLTFIIPFKSKAHSKDWAQSCRLLDATLNSLEAQSCDDYHAVLVCTDRPDLPGRYRNLTCLETDIRIEGSYDAWKGRGDKQRKVLHGLLHARALAPERAMVVDADDLLHRDLVAYVRDHGSEADAFIINKGYRYTMGSPRLRRIKPFHLASGSSMIFPFRASDFEGIASDREVERHVMTREAHPKPAEKVFAEAGWSYRYIPFPAAIYVRGHTDSIRDKFATERQGAPAKTRLRGSNLRKRASTIIAKILARAKGSPVLDAKMRHDFPGLPAPQPR